MRASLVSSSTRRMPAAPAAGATAPAAGAEIAPVVTAAPAGAVTAPEMAIARAGDSTTGSFHKRRRRELLSKTLVAARQAAGILPRKVWRLIAYITRAPAFMSLGQLIM